MHRRQRQVRNHQPAGRGGVGDLGFGDVRRPGGDDVKPGLRVGKQGLDGDGGDNRPVAFVADRHPPLPHPFAGGLSDGAGVVAAERRHQGVLRQLRRQAAVVDAIELELDRIEIDRCQRHALRTGARQDEGVAAKGRRRLAVADGHLVRLGLAQDQAAITGQAFAQRHLIGAAVGDAGQAERVVGHFRAQRNLRRDAQEVLVVDRRRLGERGGEGEAGTRLIALGIDADGAQIEANGEPQGGDAAAQGLVLRPFGGSLGERVERQLGLGEKALKEIGHADQRGLSLVRSERA